LHAADPISYLNPIATRKQSAEDVEAQVQERLPHLRLANRAKFAGKDLPATWLCTLHDRLFRAKASSLGRPGAVGCPDCLEAKAFEKRRRRLADPDMHRHLALITKKLGKTHTEVYRLRCSGKKLKEIGIEFGVDAQRIANWLFRIRSVLAEEERS
jgi:hypothetical protein